MTHSYRCPRLLDCIEHNQALPIPDSDSRPHSQPNLNTAQWQIFNLAHHPHAFNEINQ